VLSKVDYKLQPAISSKLWRYRPVTPKRGRIWG
jgi:hypothetical protein